VTVALLCAAALATYYVFRSQIRTWRVEYAISRFEKNPTQDKADALIYFLDNKAANTTQGERILRLLFRPELTKAQTYQQGETVAVGADRQFRIKLDKAAIMGEESVWVNGQRQASRHLQGGSTIVGPERHHCYLRPAPNSPGTYEMQIQYEYSFFPYLVQSKWIWPAPGRKFPANLIPFHAITRPTPPFAPEPLYHCKFAVPVEIVLMQKQKVPPIPLISNPELDTAMQAAFKSRADNNCQYSYRTATGLRRAAGAIEISYENVAAAAAFEPLFEYPDGHQVGPQPNGAGAITIGAGSSGSFYVTALDFCFEQPDDYKGTVVLKPDPNNSWSDPPINAIWNGQLRFPARFVVRRARESRQNQ
jgi:hypothetical protein